jgi:hypothetical protein
VSLNVRYQLASPIKLKKTIFQKNIVQDLIAELKPAIASAQTKLAELRGLL